jgi:hypothetical protein
MIHNEFSFQPNHDWEQWDLQFLGELSKLYNQEVNGTHSSYKEGVVIDALVAGTDRTHLLISVRISKELITIITWEDPEYNDYSVLIDILNKKILIDKKERLYHREEIKFLTNKKTTSTTEVY